MADIDVLLGVIDDHFNDLKSNSLFLACLEDARTLKITVNGHPQKLEPLWIVSQAAQYAKILLETSSPMITKYYRGVLINQYLPEREELVYRLCQLIDKCK